VIRSHSTAAKVLAVIFAATSLIGAWAAHAGPLEDATSAYEKRDFTTALNLWRPLAKQGNATAQRGLGILYDNGLAVEKNEVQATIWMRKAAEQGDAEAEYRLGEMYVQGSNGLAHDLSQGLALMTKAAEQGNVHSQYGLGQLYWYGQFGVPKDTAKAVAWHRKAADLGYALSASSLGIAYEFGIGVPKDIDQAAGWYRKAAQQDGPLKRRAELAVSRLERMIKPGSDKDGR
jgi:TPR repeat protein